MKKNVFLISGLFVLFALILITLFFFFRPTKSIEEYSIVDNPYITYRYINTYNEYLKYLNDNINDEYNYEYNYERADTNNEELTSDNFDGPYLLLTMPISSCGENIDNHYLNYSSNHYNAYYDISYSCGACAPMYITFIYKVHTLDNAEDIEVNVYSKVVSREQCDPNIAYKPIIYIYPEEDMDLTIKLGNINSLTYTYPKYKNSWNVRVSSNGNIYDYDTNRNYYGLYWEAIDNYKLNMDTGFVVKGSDTVKFLEEKLAILGLNEYEINEYIIYWIDKLEGNSYNFISFRKTEDINELMPLYISSKPDTIIRIMMDVKALDSYIEVKEQVLESAERKGFTLVEWGGTIHKEI